MKVQDVAGIKGYEGNEQRFISATISLDFETLYREFLPFIPLQPGRILDVGAGIGKDAYTFSQMGHTVTAAEPLDSFRQEGQKRYTSGAIEWVDDALPFLHKIKGRTGVYDFILAGGVWHHLNEVEQARSLLTLAQLLKPAGIFAVTVRKGPAGLGTQVFSVCTEQMIGQAKQAGLVMVTCIIQQPSIVANKEAVTWSKLVFQKEV